MLLQFLSLLTLTQSPAATSPVAPPIVLDAQFDDWATIQPIAVDPSDDAPGAFVDLGEVRVNVDDNFVHLLIDFGRNVNVQGLDGTAMIVINADGNDATGEPTHGVMGADIILDLTPPFPDKPGAAGRGIGLRSTTYKPDPNNPNLPPLNPYDVQMAFAPTHAGRRIEFRLGRGVFPKLPPLFTGRSFTGQVVFADLVGSIRDETDAFTVALSERAPSATTQPDDAQQAHDPLARASGTQVRVVNWNVERSAIVSNPDPFVRTINALRPDVILLEELTDQTTPQDLAAFAARLSFAPAARAPEVAQWHTIIGSGGGDLRCAILTRLPLTPLPALDSVTYLDRPDRTIRVAGGVIEVAGRKLVVAPLHLKCCGRMDSPEDLTRLAEVDALHQAIANTCGELKPDGVVVAGDFNLVGSREPLERLMTGLDLDGSPLATIDAYQIDGRSNATWADRNQPFVPGRLDFALLTDSTLEVRGCFVYDAHDLAPRWREVHRTQADDTDLASDHLPLVFDLSWR